MDNFAGFVELGDTLQILLQSRNPDGFAPINADALPTFRVYGQTGIILTGTVEELQSGTITGATNATPIVITSDGHGLATGSVVTISGVEGNTNANGTFIATVIDPNTFSLNGTSGNSAYTSGGTWSSTGLYAASIEATSGNSFASGVTYCCEFSWTVSDAIQSSLVTFVVT